MEQGTWVSDTPVEMEQPRPTPRELEAVCTPVELDATGNTFDISGSEKDISSVGTGRESGVR